MELHCLDVVKDRQQVGLDGMWVTGLTQNLKQGGVGHKEESREQETFLLQVAVRNEKLFICVEV